VVAGLFLLTFCLATAPVHADGSIMVTTTADLVAVDGGCSLREAVMAANSDQPVNECAGGDGADTIRFDPNLAHPVTIQMTIAGREENDAAQGDLDIVGPLTIDGMVTGTIPVADSRVTIDGGQLDRLFEIHSGATVTLESLVLRNGNPGSANGGALRVDRSASLTLSNSTVMSNTASAGGGIWNAARLNLYQSLLTQNQGGGLHNAGGLVQLTDSRVIDSRGAYAIRNEELGALTMVNGLLSDNQQGGLYNNRATAKLTNVALVNNQQGGALHNEGNTLTRLTLTHSLVLSNTATNGGGLLNQGVGARATVVDSNFQGNRATASGGAIFNNGLLTVARSAFLGNAAKAGGAIRHFGGAFDMTNSTLVENHATDNGGALYNGSDATVKHLTLHANWAGSVGDTASNGGNIFNDEAQLSLSNVLVAAASGGGNCFNSSGFIHSLGNNLEEGNSCEFTATGDLPGTTALIGTAGYYGGPTVTAPLLAGSPAVDQGDPSATRCVPTDQRGVARPQGAGCDIGAFEVGAFAMPLTMTVQPTQPTSSAVVTLAVNGIAPTACVPRYEGYTVAGATIAITTTLPLSPVMDRRGAGTSYCLPVPTPWSYQVPVGPLAAGDYTATHQLGTQQDQITFTVGAPAVPPIVDLRAINSGPTKLGNPTTFTATVQSSEPITFAWDFGDGSTETGAVVNHTYAHAGTYAARVFATNGMTTAVATTTALIFAIGELEPVQVSWVPQAPTIADSITIAVQGIHRDSCIPSYASHKIVGQTITIVTAPSTELVCRPVETAWGYSLQLEPLASGRYTLTHQLGSLIDHYYFVVTEVTGTAVPTFARSSLSVTISVDTPLRYVVQAVGNPPPHYSLLHGPAGMTIDAESGELRWTPTTADVGTVAVTVRATNRMGSADLTVAFIVTKDDGGSHTLFLPIVEGG